MSVVAIVMCGMKNQTDSDVADADSLGADSLGGDELGADELDADSLERAMFATFDGLLSTVQSAERIVSASMALRAARIDQLRIWSETMSAVSAEPRAHGADTEPAGWTGAVRGRRELVFELACALRMPETAVDRLLAESRRLIHVLPATNDALREGEISYRHAQVMVDQTATLPDDASAAFEAELLPFAKNLTVAKFTAVARK